MKISIQGYISEQQAELRASVLQLILDRHGWVLEEKPASASACHVLFQIALFDIVEVYGALQQTGIQFTPLAHRALTEACLCQKHLADREEVQIVTIDMRVKTQEEERVHFLRFVQLDAV